MNLILLHRDELDADGVAHLGGDRGAHVTGVLRARPGQQIRIGLLDGPLGLGTVVSVAPGVALRCEFDADTPPRPRVDLLLALPRPKVMRRLWSQLAALGVGQVILTSAARVERDYFGTHVLDPETYTPLLVEGLQQARDTRVPVVSIHRRFKVLLEDHLDGLFPRGARVAAQPGAAASVGRALADQPDRALIAIGPEGGWTPFELNLLARHGFRAAGMGPRTLRSDTATIALLTLAHQALASLDAAKVLVDEVRAGGLHHRRPGT